MSDLYQEMLTKLLNAAMAVAKAKKDLKLQGDKLMKLEQDLSAVRLEIENNKELPQEEREFLLRFK